jgi:hypothetical protein
MSVKDVIFAAIKAAAKTPGSVRVNWMRAFGDAVFMRTVWRRIKFFELSIISTSAYTKMQNK